MMLNDKMCVQNNFLESGDTLGENRCNVRLKSPCIQVCIHACNWRPVYTYTVITGYVAGLAGKK